MSGFTPALVLLGVVLAGAGICYFAGQVLALARDPLVVVPFAGGLPPTEHAVSRYHARWYPLTMIFLAFDMEMIFMYPWVRVVRAVGPSAVIEMFLFLGILLVGVAYAWREGALRWT